jgi:hypothetical protein
VNVWIVASNQELILLKIKVSNQKLNSLKGCVKMENRKLYIALLSIIIFVGKANAQWECPSKMGAFLKPVSEGSNLSWATESNAGFGILDSNLITNFKIFGGLDYSKNNHAFYMEGGFKFWSKSNMETNNDAGSGKLGMRELFYKYSNNKTNFTAGLHTTEGKDYLTLNERTMGVELSHNFHKFNLNAIVGSVSNDFARNGTFGSKCFIYDFDRNRNQHRIANGLGESNFAYFSLSFLPKQVIESETSDEDDFSTEGDEFSSSNDEFSDNGDFSTDSEATKSFFQTEEFGLLVYDEFGSFYDENRFYTGLFAEFKLFETLSWKNEILYQGVDKNQAMLFYSSLYKDIMWSSPQRTTFYTSYYGKINIDDNAPNMLSFSNINAGEVMRMDAMDSPLLLMAVRHSLMKYRLRFKLQYTMQFEKDNMREIDLKVSKKLWKNWDINLILAYMQTDNFDDDIYMIRGVVRYTY